jgi:hypothetical protein
MKDNEHAVSPVIGVMLMIVVTIIIAAVVSAFAVNTDMAKRAGPSSSLSSQLMYSTEGQEVSITWDIPKESQPAVDCRVDNSEFCQNLARYYEPFRNVLITSSDLPSNPTSDDYELVEGYCEMAAYSGEETCNFPGSTVMETVGSGTYLANKDGLLFTDNGGDPLDLKDLELSVRYYDLASTVYYSDTKRHAPPTIPLNAQNIAGQVAAYESLGNRYFVKVNATNSEDTIIRSGDQFMFLVDHQDGAANNYDPTNWALSSVRSDGESGASIGINTNTGQMEWWLIHAPSGNTLAHGKFEIPNT